ncbi:MAG: hypothetical protein M0R06_00160 [Sphaerochaeta sp.]|jgi:hypothetical protein|nr:hypothetical protein [Sphaerochaeta sp.]
MIITSEALRKALKKIWPDLEFMLLSDPEWDSPTRKELEDFISRVQKPGRVDHVWECEEYAFNLMVEQRREHSKVSSKDDYNWPLGAAWVDKYRGEDLNHVVNICLTSDKGIILADHQADAIWIPDSSGDNVYSVIM